MNEQERKAAFDAVGNMEIPLVYLEDLCRAVLIMASDSEGEKGGVMCSLMGLAIDKCKTVEKLRGELFRLTHPSRDHFEKEGWPA